MQANELRVGNLLHYVNEPELVLPDVVEVESITEYGINLPVEDDISVSSVDYNFDDLEGIPLTEEWLLKFGFQKKDLGNFEHHFNGFPLQKNQECFLYFTFNHRYRDVKYVHQLQNLYFALTGEELKLK